MLKALCALFCAIGLLAGSAHAISLGDSIDLSPYWDWKTIETEHFRVTFPVELTDAAQRSANLLEEAQAVLGPKLHWEPDKKVYVLLIDNADAANGLTAPIGRVGIVLWATPPDNWFSTAYYDDWLKLLVFHEYTHYLNMDTTTGVWQPLRYIFGDVLLPNAFWPSWMLEGLAVWMETRTTRGGRGRSPFYEAILRAAAEADALDDEKFITLDKINGRNPHYPGGETAYLFGYQLMNQVARNPVRGGMTADGDSPVRDGEDQLGVMSLRSSGRFPYFINGNLENITGKDWYGFWDEWVQATRTRMQEQLKRIRSQPVSKLEPVTQEEYEVLGSAVSPDGKWLAYALDSKHRRMGLFLKDLRTGEARRVEDKMMGTSIAFTPDSKTIIHSVLRKTARYYSYSDLIAYDIEDGSSHWLTKRLRARDPDVSPDGQWVTYTRTDRGRTGLSIAKLTKGPNGRYRLSDYRALHVAAAYDRVSTPKFTRDGKSIVYTLHRNGSPSEDLMSVDVATGKVSTLVADGAYNRFPAIARSGDIYFVSDATGVDNLYRYRAGAKPQLVTNVTTALTFPSFVPGDEKSVYASVLSYTGWDLMKVSLLDKPVSTDSISVSPPPAPAYDAAADAKAKPVQYEVEDYSIFPSIWPRQWAPIVYLSQDETYIGGQVLGFDAVDEHRYIVGAAWYAPVGKPDLLASYSNRTLGPTVSLLAEARTSETGLYDTVELNYGRTTALSGAISFPFTWTYSSLTPQLSFNMERFARYLKDPPFDDVLLERSRYVPSVDGLLFYSNAESSRLAITTEGGRNTMVGARAYLEPDSTNWKLIATDTEHFRITDHTILVPSAKIGYVTNYSDTYRPGNVVIEGRSRDLFDSLPSNNFTQFGLRGYPLRAFYTRAAGVFSLDYRFPLARIFRGSGTNPLFMENLFGFTFAESAYFPLKEFGFTTLPSAGTGIGAETQVLNNIPLTFSLEYHHGFRKSVGGKGEVFLQIGFGNFDF